MDSGEEWLVLDEIGSDLDGQEDNIASVTALPQKKRQCPVCPRREPHVKRHVLQEHFPFYISPDTACWVCGQQEAQRYKIILTHQPRHRCEGVLFESGKLDIWVKMMRGVVQFFCQEFQQSAAGLLEMVREKKWFPDQTGRVTDVDHALWSYYEVRNDLPEMVEHLVSPPNSIAALFHWRILSKMLMEIPMARRVVFKEWEEVVEIGVRDVEEPYQVADSHFHLAELLRDVRMCSLQEVLDKEPVVDEAFVLQLAIAIYCYPWKWPDMEEQRHILRDHRLRLAFGVHPRFASRFREREDLPRLRRYLQGSQVVALGEVGVDFSPGVKQRDQECQGRVLQSVLPLARELELPVVIHCRGEGAQQECLQCLQRILRQEHVIHFHCFMGTPKDMAILMKAFPNAKFGFTGAFLSEDSKDLREAVGMLRLDQILIESDAPFLRPPAFKKRARSCNPGMVLEVAKGIAKVKNLPLRLICRATLQNVRQLYRIAQ